MILNFGIDFRNNSTVIFFFVSQSPLPVKKKKKKSKYVPLLNVEYATGLRPEILKQFGIIQFIYLYFSKKKKSE